MLDEEMYNAIDNNDLDKVRELKLKHMKSKFPIYDADTVKYTKYAFNTDNANVIEIFIESNLILDKDIIIDMITKNAVKCFKRLKNILIQSFDLLNLIFAVADYDSYEIYLELEKNMYDFMSKNEFYKLLPFELIAMGCIKNGHKIINHLLNNDTINFYKNNKYMYDMHIKLCHENNSDKSLKLLTELQL